MKATIMCRDKRDCFSLVISVYYRVYRYLELTIPTKGEQKLAVTTVHQDMQRKREREIVYDQSVT